MISRELAIELAQKQQESVNNRSIMRPTLILQPIHCSSADILKTFMDKKPLSAEQLNFLEWHQRELSNAWYDPILNYYLQSRHHVQRQFEGTFLLPHEEINFEAIQALKKRIQATLRDKSQAVITLTQDQFLKFKEYTIPDLIFWHGNQLLSGSSFYPGGIPPVIFFQWGNYFGISKYVIFPAVKNYKANILVYFENMQNRDLNRCVEDYTYQLQQTTKLQNEIVYEKKLISPNEFQSNRNQPSLNPSHYFLADHL